MNGNDRSDERPGESRTALVLTGGIDMVHTFSARASLLAVVRYVYVPGLESRQYLGVWPNVLRAGIGLRVRVN